MLTYYYRLSSQNNNIEQYRSEFERILHKNLEGAYEHY